MATPAVLTTGIAHRYVYELRYEFGQVYWDRAGRIAKEILAENKEWEFDAIDLNRCRLSHRDSNMMFNFGPEKLDLSQTQNADVEHLLSVGEFGALAEVVTSIVVEQLDLVYFPRIGFRKWRLYGTTDREQSYQFMRDLKLFRMESSVTDALGEIFEVSHRLVVERKEHMVRIALGPFEQQVALSPSIIRAAKEKAHQHPRQQKQILIDQMMAKRKIEHYPLFGILLDMDAYVEDPPYPDGLSVSDFIATADDDFDDLRRTVLTPATK